MYSGFDCGACIVEQLSSEGVVAIERISALIWITANTNIRVPVIEN